MNGKEHLLGGFIGGPVAGIAWSLRANRQPTLVEACGWFASGALGAKAPDLLEPAICPTHRRFCHSGCVLAFNLAALQNQGLQDLVQGLCDRAAEYHRWAEIDQTNAVRYELSAYLFEFLAGVVPGFLGGYVSHLFLDLSTPSRLPLL